MTEYILVFLAAAGLLLLLWVFLGILLRPVFRRNMVSLYFVRGDGGELEQACRAYGWLRDGRRSGGTLVLVDCGLSAQGLDLAQRLTGEYPWTEYCPLPALTDYIELTEIQMIEEFP